MSDETRKDEGEESPPPQEAEAERPAGEAPAAEPEAPAGEPAPAEEPVTAEEELAPADEELKAIKDELAAGGEGEGGGGEPDEVSQEVLRAEVQEALDAEDGLAGVSDEEAEARRTGDEALEHVRTLTGFRRAHLPLMLLLPPLTYWMYICVTFYGGRVVIPTSWSALVELVSHLPPPTWQALLIFLGWMGLQAGLQAFAPGKVVYGTPLPDGRRLPYKMNGLLSFWITVGLAGLLVLTGALPATLLADQFGPLLTIGHLFAFAFSGYLYFSGKAKPEGEHTTGKPLYDYFMGTARNPRIGDFDLKLFFEARPGLILWTLINFSFAARQYALHGAVTTPMILVCAFHFLYVADYYFHEKAILSTMDIKHENFGWMLCWGDYPWVPFTYTIQAMYLVEHTHDLAWWAVVGIVALNLGGFFLFRAVNSQKDRFRDDPEAEIWGQKPSYIKTKRGTLLLTSGYWGLSRHLNYMGDLMLGLAWCLPCAFGSIFPYFYIIYFTWLLLHRQWRDDKMCKAKYGEDWDEYCRRVPWKIFPYVY